MNATLALWYAVVAGLVGFLAIVVVENTLAGFASLTKALTIAIFVAVFVFFGYLYYIVI